MDNQLHNTVSVPDEVLYQQLPDGESVFLNLESEEYFGLDRTGTRMWEALAASATLGEAHQRLVDEFGVDEARLRDDLLGLVDRLVERGLLVVGDP